MKKFLIFLTIVAIAFAEFEYQDITPFISGGSNATLGQFPYQVLIGMSTGTNNTICGGILVKHKWVLTTATCLNFGFTNYTLIFGTVDPINGTKEWQSGLIPASDFKIHPKYNNVTYENNIALIYVDDMPSNITDSKNVGVVDLPNENEAKTNLNDKEATISGYGRKTDNPNETIDLLLHYTTVKIETCKNLESYNVTESNVCINTTGGKSTCAGDYGSPLTVEISSKKILVGISSVSTKACTLGSPAVFESVFYHREWIEKTISGSTVVGVSFSVIAAMILMILRNFF